MTVSSLPLYKLNDIPDALRQVANQLEHGELSGIRCVLILETEEGNVDYKAFGEEPFTRAHAIGLCQCSAFEIYGVDDNK